MMVDYEDVVAINDEVMNSYLSRFPGYKDMYIETMDGVFSEGKSEEKATQEFIALFQSGFSKLAQTYLNDKMQELLDMGDRFQTDSDVSLNIHSIHFSAARLILHYVNNPAKYQNFIFRLNKKAIEAAKTTLNRGTSVESNIVDFQDIYASANKYKPSWRDILKQG